jgi:hypothetical protein
VGRFAQHHYPGIADPFHQGCKVLFIMDREGITGDAFLHFLCYGYPLQHLLLEEQLSFRFMQRQKTHTVEYLPL